MTTTIVHISIAVFKGDPVDYQKYRHTALWIRFRDGSPAILAHIVGPPGEFEFQVREHYDPSQSASLAKIVDVGYLQVRTTSTQLRSALRAIPINNSDPEFNCQTWIETVLKRLKDRNLLSNESYENGVDGMVDAIAEAEDEE